MASVDSNLEDLMSHLGEFGKYQLLQYLLHVLSGLTAGLHMVSLETIAAVPNFNCTKYIIEPTINDVVELTNCNYINNNNNKTYDCIEWNYDTSYYKSSLGMDWSFVCSNRWKGAIAKSAYMLGVLAGAATLGSMADKYGRKIIFCISGTAQLIIGLIVGLLGVYGDYYSWVIVRFLFGIFGSAGAYIPGFVLTMEMVGPTKRTVCGMMFQMTFAFGIVLVAFWASFIKDSMWLQVTYALHAILLLPHWWIMDESPRWLWAQGRFKEAFKIVKNALVINGSNVKLDINNYIGSNKQSKNPIVNNDLRDNKTYSAIDLLKTPNLRKKFLNVCLNWIACAISYYGLTLSSAKGHGNPYWNLALNALVEVPSYIFASYTMDKLGRRCLSSTFLLIGGMCCILAGFITTFPILISLIGKACIALSFAVIYNYTAELFPTVLRNTAVGIGSMCCRFSGALTPLLLLLDDLNKSIPSTIFGIIALLSGFLTLFLPETAGQQMPETLEDGEKFGIGDTCFTTCLGRKKTDDVYDVALKPMNVNDTEKSSDSDENLKN